MKTVEELLIPRYEVIANYPDNSRNVGDIAIIDPKKSKEWQDNHCAYFDRFPHLFRRLSWYEKRGKNEVEYIKSFYLDGRLLCVDKVEYWDEQKGFFMLDSKSRPIQICTPAHGDYPTMPATIEEYEDYQKNSAA